MGIKILTEKDEQKIIDFEQKYFNRHKSWKGNFTWRDMAFLLLGWMIGISWMLIWIMALWMV